MYVSNTGSDWYNSVIPHTDARWSERLSKSKQDFKEANQRWLRQISKVALTCCQGASAAERKIEAGNNTLSLWTYCKKPRDEEVNNSRGYNGVNLFCFCFQSAVISAVVWQIASSWSPGGCSSKLNLQSQNGEGMCTLPVLTIWSTYSWNTSIILVYGKTWSGLECDGLWKYSRNVWNNSPYVWIVSLKHLIINALLPSFPVSVLTHYFKLGGDIPISRALSLTPIPLRPCKELKQLSKQNSTSGLEWTFSREKRNFSTQTSLKVNFRG